MSETLKRNCGVLSLVLMLFVARSLQQRVEFAQIDSNADEGTSNLELTVVVSNANSPIPVSVIPMTFEQYASSNLDICTLVDSGTNNAEESDFDPTVITKDISSGETSFTISVVDDAIVEPIEELLIILNSSAPGVTLNRRCVRGVIKPDDNDTVSVVLNINGPTTVSESVGQIDYVQLVKQGETEKDVAVSIGLVTRNPDEFAAPGDDYMFDVVATTVSGQLKLTIPPQETVLNLPITIVDDMIAEYDEGLKIDVQWSIGSGNNPLQDKILIVDNDYILIDFMNATAHSIVEGESIRICASILNSTALYRRLDSITLTTQPGTAIVDKHFSVSPIIPGIPIRPVCINVAAIDDDILKESRQFQVMIIEGPQIFGFPLSPLTIINDGAVTVEIRDNDGTPNAPVITEFHPKGDKDEKKIIASWTTIIEPLRPVESFEIIFRFQGDDKLEAGGVNDTVDKDTKTYEFENVEIGKIYELKICAVNEFGKNCSEISLAQATAAPLEPQLPDDQGLPVGALIGIIIGAIILALCCCLCVVLLLVLCLWGVSERERKYFPANKEKKHAKEYEKYRTEKERSVSSESSLSDYGYENKYEV